MTCKECAEVRENVAEVILIELWVHKLLGIRIVHGVEVLKANKFCYSVSLLLI